jgi:hypothetical protein
MEIEQEVSDFSPTSTIAVAPGVTAPVFFRRNARTTVMVKDNETIVLGGLITSRQENSEQKVPVIGDIPGLGLLFRTQTDSSRRTELLLVLTPHVIRAPEDFRRVSEIERNRLEVLPEDTLSDPLMQGLQIHGDEAPLIEPAPYAPDASLYPDDRQPRRDRLRPDEYGPERPRPRPTQPADVQTYDVPLSLRPGGQQRG